MKPDGLDLTLIYLLKQQREKLNHLWRRQSLYVALREPVQVLVFGLWGHMKEQKVKDDKRWLQVSIRSKVKDWPLSTSGWEKCRHLPESCRTWNMGKNKLDHDRHRKTDRDQWWDHRRPDRLTEVWQEAFQVWTSSCSSPPCLVCPPETTWPASRVQKWSNRWMFTGCRPWQRYIINKKSICNLKNVLLFNNNINNNNIEII